MYLWTIWTVICPIVIFYIYMHNHAYTNIWNIFKQFKNKSYIIALYMYFNTIEFISLQASLIIIKTLLWQTPINVNYVIYNTKINEIQIPINRQDLIYRTMFLRYYLPQPTDTTMVTYNTYKIENHNQLMNLFDNISSHEKFNMNVDYIDQLICNYRFYKSEYKKIYKMYCNNEDNSDDNLILINKIQDIEIRINTDEQVYSMHA